MDLWVYGEKNQAKQNGVFPMIFRQGVSSFIIHFRQKVTRATIDMHPFLSEIPRFGSAKTLSRTDLEIHETAGRMQNPMAWVRNEHD